MTAQTQSGLEIWRDEGGRIAAFGHSGRDHSWLCMPPVATFRFDLGPRRVTALPEPGACPDDVEEALYRAAVPLALHAFGHEALHASAVETPRGLAVFCAPAGTGKSTTAKSLASRGWRVWADDVVVLRIEGSTVCGEPLPFRVRLRPEAANHFGVRETVLPPWTQRISSAPVAAIFSLRRDPHLSQTVCVRTLDPAEAFPVLLSNAYCFSLSQPGRKRLMMAHYAALARLTPCRELVFRPGLENLRPMAEAIEGEVT
ncbi:MAG: hypothetical protein U0Q16_39415 [Bryobacteraceae bacterium]